MVRDTRDTWSITRTRWDMGLGTIGGVMEQPPGGSHHGYLVRERLHLEHLPWHCLPGAVGGLPPNLWHPAPHHADRGLGGTGGGPHQQAGELPLAPPTPCAPPACT